MGTEEIDVNGTTEVPNLVFALMEKSMAETQRTVQQVENNYRLQIMRLHGTIAAMRQHADELLNGPYVPQPQAVYRAMIVPDAELVAEFAREYAEKHGWDPETGELGNTTGT